MSMQIVADANIPYVQEAFAGLGSVTLIPGRTITASHVRDAELLLVRSVTPVHAALLDGSRVRFVGSATIGVDHVDLKYLEDCRIAFAYAPGSNANSVAEYVIAAILALWQTSSSGRTLGIIGLGRIGSLVRAKAESLGIGVLANDPPLGRAGQGGLVALEELLSASEIVTCHVPLTTEGTDQTVHLLNARTLSLLRPDATVINTARGPVVDNRALLYALRKNRLGAAVLDVWEGEPVPDAALIQAAAIGTPHIAGYSLDGKIKGTEILYEAACAFLKRPTQWRAPRAVLETDTRTAMQADLPVLDIVQAVVKRSYDIRRDDAALKATTDLPAQARGPAFDDLRATYPARWEFSNTSILLSGAQPGLERALKGLGFTVAKAGSAYPRT